jgi:NAD+ kinase
MYNRRATNLPRLAVFGHLQRHKVAEVVEEFRNFAKSKTEIVVICSIDSCSDDVIKNCDFAVVFGGDGSIISAAKNLSRAGVPMIGVNLGKLGYLAEFSVGELKQYFDEIIGDKLTIEKRMMLKCKVFASTDQRLVSAKPIRDGAGRERFNSTAINDVFITSGPLHKMIELKMAVDGQPIAACVGDGLIISTPTGSTAYNLSAGGPILDSSMQAMVITPICPHSLSFRPIVISADSRVEIFCIRVSEGTTISTDGRDSMVLSADDVIGLEKADIDFLVVNNPMRTRWDTLAAKLGWAETPKYEGKLKNKK